MCIKELDINMNSNISISKLVSIFQCPSASTEMNLVIESCLHDMLTDFQGECDVSDASSKYQYNEFFSYISGVDFHEIEVFYQEILSKMTELITKTVSKCNQDLYQSHMEPKSYIRTVVHALSIKLLIEQTHSLFEKALERFDNFYHKIETLTQSHVENSQIGKLILDKIGELVSHENTLDLTGDWEISRNDFTFKDEIFTKKMSDKRLVESNEIPGQRKMTTTEESSKEEDETQKKKYRTRPKSKTNTPFSIKQALLLGLGNPSLHCYSNKTVAEVPCNDFNNHINLLSIASDMYQKKIISSFQRGVLKELIINKDINLMNMIKKYILHKNLPKLYEGIQLYIQNIGM